MKNRATLKIAQTCILTINGGSSSIKFALYQINDPPKRLIYGKIDRIGLPGTNLTFSDSVQNRQGNDNIEASDHKSAVTLLINWLIDHAELSSVKAVGHRVVHGMNYSAPELVTQELLDELHRISPYAPDQLPSEIELIEVLRQHYPELPQVACFDTAFHRTMPRVAKLLAIPRRFDANGIQRYGFHGLSYTYLLEEIVRIVGPKASQGRVILAHLGNGASLAAVHEGKSIDTSMGFTPAGGVPMGSRPGDLNPGVSWYLMQTEKLTPIQFNNLINHESGLLGISETSSDMHDLLDLQASDSRAAEAVELFCYQVKKWIGAFAAALGGIETLVFSGGIGENAPEVRSRICSGLEFLGIELEEKQNMANAGMISAATSRVSVRVMHTDEEQMIARLVCHALGLGIASEKSNSDRAEK